MPMAMSRTNIRLLPILEDLRLSLTQRRDLAKKSRALRNRYEATKAELMGLTDRDLADIGISRADIPRLAREHVELESRI